MSGFGEGGAVGAAAEEGGDGLQGTWAICSGLVRVVFLLGTCTVAAFLAALLILNLLCWHLFLQM